MRKTHSSHRVSLKALGAALLAMPLMTSCLDSDSDSTWGVTYGTTDYVYANTNKVYLAFSISADWELYKTETAEWITFGTTSGSGPFAGYIPVTFEKNETGEVRYCVYKVTATDDATFSGSISQSATRGDGSFGTAPLVSKITGTDGSEIDITYDTTYDIPESITISKDGETLMERLFVYNSSDTTLYIMDGSDVVLYGIYNSAWNPSEEMESDEGDELDWGYNSSLLANANRINVDWTAADGSTDERTYGINTITDIDCQIFHETIEVDAYDAETEEDFETGSMDIVLGSDTDYEDYVSNQYQNVDVNQLMFGIERCNPYQLLGLYRWSRCGYIYETVSGDDGDYSFTPELNSDGSVASLAIEDPSGSTITYTFEY